MAVIDSFYLGGKQIPFVVGGKHLLGVEKSRSDSSTYIISDLPPDRRIIRGISRTGEILCIETDPAFRVDNALALRHAYDTLIRPIISEKGYVFLGIISAKINPVTSADRSVLEIHALYLTEQVKFLIR